MLTILFLDDSPRRTANFKSAFPWATCVDTAEACIAQLSKQAWDIVCLDHDLGGDVFVDSARDDTGMGVVRWVATNKPKVGKFYVHTLNEKAGFRMVLALQQADYQVDRAEIWYLANDIKAMHEDALNERGDVA